MKAHSMRRSLWILSVALGAGVVGLAAWFVLDVKKEVEAVPKVSPKRIAQAKDPKKLDKTHRDIKTVLDTFGSKVKQVVQEKVIRAPIEVDRLQKAILRDSDYKKMEPSHWIFSGPMPSGVYPKPPEPEPEKVQPKGLDAVGKPTLIWLLGNGDGLLNFRFNDKAGKTFRFRRGQWIWPYGDDGADGTKDNPVPKSEKRFRVKEFRQAAEGVFEVVAEVYNDPDKPPVSIDRARWDARPKLRDDGPIRLVGKPAPNASPTGDTTASAGSGDTAAPEGADTTGTPAGGDAQPGSGAAVVQPGAEDSTTSSGAGAVAVAPEDDSSKFTRITPVDELKPEDLKPSFQRNPKRPDTTDVQMDGNSYRYFKHHGVKKIIEEVKTKPTKHGVQIQSTGSAPIDNFRIKRGDTIVAIDGQPVKTRADIVRIAEGMPESTKFVKITLMSRSGTRRTYNVDVTDPKNRRDVARYGNVGGN